MINTFFNNQKHTQDDLVANDRSLSLLDQQDRVTQLLKKGKTTAYLEVDTMRWILTKNVIPSRVSP